jgi:hypothetical protein
MPKTIKKNKLKNRKFKQTLKPLKVKKRPKIQSQKIHLISINKNKLRYKIKSNLQTRSKPNLQKNKKILLRQLFNKNKRRNRR